MVFTQQLEMLVMTLIDGGGGGGGGEEDKMSILSTSSLSVITVMSYRHKNMVALPLHL